MAVPRSNRYKAYGFPKSKKSVAGKKIAKTARKHKKGKR